MNIRFYHAKILLTKADHTFEVAEGELWVRGDHICYIGDGTDTSAVCKEGDIIIWDREIDAKGNLLMAAAESVPKRGKAERGGYLLACNPRNYGVPDEWYHLKF